MRWFVLVLLCFSLGGCAGLTSMVEPTSLPATKAELTAVAEKLDAKVVQADAALDARVDMVEKRVDKTDAGLAVLGAKVDNLPAAVQLALAGKLDEANKALAATSASLAVLQAQPKVTLEDVKGVVQAQTPSIRDAILQAVLGGLKTASGDAGGVVTLTNGLLALVAALTGKRVLQASKNKAAA